MNFREVTEDDYVELSTWFADIRKPYPVKSGILPLVGVVAFDEQGLVSCAFLKQDGTSVCRIEWIASNPKRANAYRSESTEKLLEFIKQSLQASNPDIKLLEIITQSDFLIQTCLKNDFVPIRNFTRLLYSYEDNPRSMG